jgi:RNA12 protein
MLKRINIPSIVASDHLSVAERAIPSDAGIEITKVIPWLNEGGLFVKYSRRPDRDDTDIERVVRDHLQKHPMRPWFNPLCRVDVGLVLGKPWIEDMYRSPSQRLKVEFLPTSSGLPAVEMTQEALYPLFRCYGTLKDIERQPPTSPITPRFAYVEFSRAKVAVLAKCCVHGLTVLEKDGGGKHGTILKITYEKRYKGAWLIDWLFNHPRIVIPALAALIAAITVIIFDPIRTFFIKMKIKSWLIAEDKGIWHWIRTQVNRANILSFSRQGSETNLLSAVWDDRKDDIEQLRTWLGENSGTFIVVQGPQGSGKRELVLDQALQGRKYKLVVDCKLIQEARGDAKTISVAAAQVGYWPVFSWMNSISSFFDMIAQSMIGTKAGFSETLDAQLGKVLQNTASALKQVALESRDQDKDSQLSDEQYLDAHHKERPVVVIENFSERAGDKTVVYDKVAEWAAALTTANIAHVIFLTTDASSRSKSLRRALPNQVFRVISLRDCSLEVGRKFLLRYLEREQASEPNLERGLENLEGCIATVGGRLTDLEFMAHRIKTGETPISAW